MTIASEIFTVEAEQEQFLSFKANCVHKYENQTDALVKIFMLISYLP